MQSRNEINYFNYGHGLLTVLGCEPLSSWNVNVLEGVSLICVVNQ